MNFRWKTQQNQQPVNMGGQAAYDASVSAAGGNLGTPVSVQPFEAERKELAQLKGELAQIDAEIAQFDRENPGFGSGMSEIAAKRAEAGDMGAYDSMVTNALNSQMGAAANQKSATEAVYNHVNEARKLASAIDDKSSEFRAEKMDNIRVSLDEAKRKADASGVSLPKEWYDLDRKYNESISERNRGGMRAEAIDNDYYMKDKENSLENKDIEKLQEIIKDDPNSELATEVRALIEKYKGKTNEKKDAYKKRKQTAESKFNSWDKNRSVIAKKAEWAELIKKKHPITVFFELNEFGNPVRKKGM